jgi:hypothetical protein
MTDALTHVVRSSLANLIGLYHEGNLSRDAKKTLTELVEALMEKGEDMTEYKQDYANVLEDTKLGND